jgi:uncharacterized protein with HEPN domain
MDNKDYCFELFCIDPEDIHSEKAFLAGLSASGSLWNNKDPQNSRAGGLNTLIESDSGLCIKVFPVDTTKILTGFVEVAFILKVTCPNFSPLESFRMRLLRHLREMLRFRHIRILQDDISSEIANKLYPEINAVENLLRRYLIKFFIQRVGIDWWEVTATPKMIEKVNNRLRNRANKFSYFIDPDIEFADFDDLGLLIYKQSTGFNEPEKVMEKLMEIESLDDLELLKSELRGNYTKYFKQFFRDRNFERLWKEMSRIRNKVAHQAAFFQDELDRGTYLSAELQRIIRDAEAQIDKIVLSLEEKEAILQASIDALHEGNSEDDAETAAAKKADADNRIKLEGPKVIGKISLPIAEKVKAGFRVITENEIISELDEAMNLSYTEYVGLKWFVTTYLANKNYAIGTTYSLVNILIEKERVELYDMPSPDGYTIKAIRLPR